MLWCRNLNCSSFVCHLKLKKLNLVYLGRCWREWYSKLHKKYLEINHSRRRLKTFQNKEKNRWKIPLLILSESMYFYSPLKSSENIRFSDAIQGDRGSLTHLNAFNIRTVLVTIPNKGEFSIINHAKALNKLFIHLKLQYQLICC